MQRVSVWFVRLANCVRTAVVAGAVAWPVVVPRAAELVLASSTSLPFVAHLEAMTYATALFIAPYSDVSRFYCCRNQPRSHVPSQRDCLHLCIAPGVSDAIALATFEALVRH